MSAFLFLVSWPKLAMKLDKNKQNSKQNLYLVSSVLVSHANKIR